MEDSFCKIARYYASCRGATNRSSPAKILYCIIASLTNFSLLTEDFEELKRKHFLNLNKTKSKNKKRIVLKKTNFEIVEENENFVEKQIQQEENEFDELDLSFRLKELRPFPDCRKKTQMTVPFL